MARIAKYRLVPPGAFLYAQSPVSPPQESEVNAMSKDLRQAALLYHAEPTPGKIKVELSTPAETQYDLSLAYSPGVAAPCLEIAADPANAYRYTGKGNLVGVISNGTAVLGLGNLGALASKPVMEGKALLFKRFADINAIDIEVNTEDADEFIATVASIADSFGGINLEDIKAPECFEIEASLIERCEIPVFHDDQHGTAIVTAAGLISALEVQGKTLEEAVITCLGAGSAAIACMRLLVRLGARRENIYMLDRRGVIYGGREGVNVYKEEFSNNTDKRSLTDAIRGADVFIGLSGANLLSSEMLLSMADKPIVFACSNPDPEINPELAHATRNDLIMATGRSDYPNQVNNVLGFPFIFRGALDVRARRINEEMKIAAVHALRELAKEEVPAEVLAACELESLAFGPEYIIPKPMDRRLLSRIAPAVARAAIDSGVAGLPLPEGYAPELTA
jgi:malate dehydrogenase (oxaloacetate-decarboxylating)(NADP+)